MRVISQDGSYDIPYENCIFQQFQNGIWCVNNSITANEDGYKIAEYSNEEKALKVMEMLRNAYTGVPFAVAKNHKLTDEEIKEIAKGNVDSIFDYSGYSRVVSGNNNIVFQFPKDYEVQV